MKTLSICRADRSALKYKKDFQLMDNTHIVLTVKVRLKFSSVQKKSLSKRAEEAYEDSLRGKVCSPKHHFSMILLSSWCESTVRGALLHQNAPLVCAGGS